MSLRDGVDMLKTIKLLRPKLSPWREACATTGMLVAASLVAWLFEFDLLRTCLSAAVLFALLLVVRCFSEDEA